MKSHDNLMKTSKIIKILRYSVIFLSFLLNCTSAKNSIEIPSIKGDPNSKNFIFSSFPPEKNLSLSSEKFSSKVSILIIMGSGKAGTGVTYAEYILSAFPKSTLLDSLSILKVEIPRITFSEKIFQGVILKSQPSIGFEIELSRGFIKRRQGNSLEEIFESISKLRATEMPVALKYVFQSRKQRSLWKKEEWIYENNSIYIWRNFENEAILIPDVAFTEFLSPFGSSYSKINKVSEYIFSFSNPTQPLKIFSVDDTDIFLEPNFIYDGNQFQNGEEKMKNSLPKLYLHKNLKQYGN